MSRQNTSENLLQIANLKLHFPVQTTLFSRVRHVKAVDDVSFTIPRQTIFGLVGESGSGKTTLGRAILQLIKPTGGSVLFNGSDLCRLNRRQLLPFRRQAQIISQDPYNALHPRKLIKTIIGEGLKIHGSFSRGERYEKMKEILEQVGLREEHLFRYPHEFSGGQRQRLSIARALVLDPQFLTLDEPTSALDVSVQAVVLKMLLDFRQKFSLTYLFITHDLAVIDYLCDIVAVIYLGKIMELAPKEEFFQRPAHPYTQLLLDSIPIADPRQKMTNNIASGEIPSPLSPPPGCRFNSRCRYVKSICREQEPPLQPIAADRLLSCHFPL